MNETKLRELNKSIDWVECKDFNLPEMPMSQGLLIKHLIEHYKIPFHAVGYSLDKVGIRTKKQVIFWKDTGIGARWLGLINLETDKVSLPKGITKANTSKILKSFKELKDLINKRDYNNILGLKAKITQEDYYYFLEVLPPIQSTPNSFILSEALNDNLYYKFSNIQGVYYCEVVELKDEEIEVFERNR
jgi:hypothetical protein